MARRDRALTAIRRDCAVRLGKRSSLTCPVDDTGHDCSVLFPGLNTHPPFAAGATGYPRATGDRTRLRRRVVSKRFHKGEKVTWSAHGGTAEGEVLEEITSDTEAADRTVRASKDDPQYRVRSEKSGGEAVHMPSALKKK